MRRHGLVALTLLMLGVLGCGDAPTEAPDDASPTALALQLFELAQAPEPAIEAVRELFSSDLVDDDGYRRAALLDAIRRLQLAQPPRVLTTQELAGLDRVAVDLQADLPEDGYARYSVQLDTSGARPTIAWFSGPDVEWPEKTRRGSGLTTSAPPNAEGG